MVILYPFLDYMSIFIFEKSDSIPKNPNELHFSHVIKLLNSPNVKMIADSIETLIDLAYQKGYKDGQNSVSQKEI